MLVVVVEEVVVPFVVEEFAGLEQVDWLVEVATLRDELLGPDDEIFPFDWEYSVPLADDAHRG